MDLKQTFGSADLIEDEIVVFNIGGNKYRLVASVSFTKQIVTVLRIKTHAKYDKEGIG